jgi:hypothetical protein
MAPTKKSEYKKFWTPEFRASFPALDEPKLGPDQTGEAKYSVRMLFPKEMNEENAKLFAMLRKGTQQAAIDYWGADAIPKNLKKPLKDGDADSDYDNEKGFWIMNARTNQKIEVVDERCRLLTKEEIKDKVYAGCWCRATVAVGATEKAGNKAVHLVLNNVQFLRDDKPFGNRKRATDDFKPVVFSDGENDFKSDDEDGF